MLTKTIMVWALAAINQLVSAGPVAAEPVSGWDKLNSTAIDYETFTSLLSADTVPFIGPKGLYAYNSDVGTVYVDMFPGGELATKNPAWRDSLISWLTGSGNSVPGGLEFLSGGTLRLSKRQATCGETCNAPGHIRTCYSCTCKFSDRIQNGPWAWVDIWSCR
jgi:hypothetical protein